MLVRNYFRAFDRHIGLMLPRNTLEVGCGEGYIMQHVIESSNFPKVVGVDISHKIIRLAKVNCEKGRFSCASAYSLPFQSKSFDFVLCVEVLEHLVLPEVALEEISRVASDFILFSVPQEPIWRMVNVTRGAYIRDLGNTPGHVQHWTRKSIVRLLEKHFKIVEISYPFPWTMISCRKPGQE